MARPLTGTLVKRSNGYHVLIRTHGQEHLIDLETPEMDLARQRQPRAVRKFLAGLTRPAPKGRAVVVPALTMAEVAVGVYEARKAGGIKHWDNERRWWRKHAKDLHDLQPKNITAALIEQTLLAGKERGLSRRSLSAVLTEIDRILDAAKKQRLVTELVTSDVELPRVDRRKRKRVQLTDTEFVQYLNHPDTLDYSDTENTRRIARGELPLISREIKTLAVVARCIGGARASDLHALTWEAIDLVEDVIAIFRPKISHRSDDDEDATDVYQIPADVKPYLVQWWHDHGRPESGPVFPCCLPGNWRFGVRAYGGAKKSKGYARPFRRDLMTAGVTREALHKDGLKTRATDFHSLRRALVSAMRRNQIPTRLAMAIVHHTSKATHDRYDTLEREVMVMPPAALPSLPRPKLLTAGSVPTSEPASVQNPYETKSSNIAASSGESGQMSKHKTLCEKVPEPRETLAATGTYDASSFSSSVEAPGIEANCAFPNANMQQHDEPGHVAGSEPLAGNVETNGGATNEPSYGAIKKRYQQWDHSHPPKAPPGVAALQRAMTAAVAAAEWGTVKELAEALETLWAAKRMVAE